MPPKGLTEANGGFHVMSHRDTFRGVAKPEFSISSLRFGIATPNLGYLDKSSKCRVHFLGERISNRDETWCLGKGRRAMHEDTLFQIQGQG